MVELSYIRFSPRSLEETLTRLGEELKRCGFGVLATLRVHETLREKIQARIEPLVILDVCSPKHAKIALDVSRDAGLVLPCKIVVSLEGGKTRVALQRPTVVLNSLLPLKELEDLGKDVEELLSKAIDRSV